MAAKNKSNTLELSRVYDAPVKAVWDAWTDPKKAAKWWGPRGFSITTESKDLRPGGSWRYTMHGPDGTDYPNVTKYFEVEKYSKLVYDHGGTDDAPPLFRVTVTFAEKNGKTHMDMTMTFATPEVTVEMAKFIKKAGGNATWDRLAEYLDHEERGRETFVINRTFETPIENMYEMWTNPEHLSRWLSPTGTTMKFLRVNLKPGGDAFYAMTDGKTFTLHGRVNYLELTKPTLIRYTQQFCDEKENLSRHPFAPKWPETMLTTVRFTAETPTHTRVTVEWEPQGKVSAEELAAFIKERGGMTQGWTGSFDKLEELLASA